MSLPLFHEDLCELFQRSNEPFIFAKLQKNDLSLEDIRPGPENAEQSQRAIQGVMQALLHLRLNLVMPCQLKYSYVVKRGKIWGLRYAICDRNDQQAQIGDDAYNPQEYKYHIDAENELMWNIGKVWLRFFTDKEVRIKYKCQQKIYAIIDDYIPNRSINRMIKQLLCWDNKKRISFQDFLSTDFFMKKENEERSNFYSSVLGHLKTISRMGVINSKVRSDQKEILTPFTREITFRCFLEYLDIDIFLQNNFKVGMKAEYNTGDKDQMALCQFTLYIISLQNYMNMAKLNKERLEMGERFQELEHRFYYARFTKRLITLKQQIQKTAKRLKKDNLLSRFNRFFGNPDEMVASSVYDQFKSCLSEYAHFLNQDLKKDKEDFAALKLLTKIYIARTSSYIFTQFRSQVFEPFMKNQKSFNIKKIVTKISDCNDRDLLRALLMNIKKFYFDK